jgi:hypothetical protein
MAVEREILALIHSGTVGGFWVGKNFTLSNRHEPTQFQWQCQMWVGSDVISHEMSLHLGIVRRPEYEYDEVNYLYSYKTRRCARVTSFCRGCSAKYRDPDRKENP